VVLGAEQLGEGCGDPPAQLVPIRVEGAPQALLEPLDGEGRVGRDALGE
jgi:hypothetical protein